MNSATKIVYASSKVMTQPHLADKDTFHLMDKEYPTLIHTATLNKTVLQDSEMNMTIQFTFRDGFGVD